VENIKEKSAALSGDCPGVKIIALRSLAPYFRSFFQAGFLFRCQVGQSIENFLFRQLSLERDFVEKKISTVFLDGQCVDDIASATLNDASIVALSSALPGLVGATLRRDGFYACLRDSITYRTEGMAVESRQGTITVKLFNLLMDELGPVFLEKCIIMGRTAIVSFFQAQKEDFWKEISAVHLGDVSIAPGKLMEESTYNNYDHLMVCVDMINKVKEKFDIPMTG
jgi:hypothetical protein